MEARDKILETASRLFASQGYDGTSLSHVAREAKVSKALIFWHFESKDHLFREVVSHTIEPYAINLDLDGLSEPDQLAKMVDHYCSFVARNASSVRFFLSLFLRTDSRPDELFGRILDQYALFRRSLAQIIERGQQRGTLSGRVRAAAHASLLLAALNGTLVEGFVSDRKVPEAETAIAELKEALIDPIRVG
ncbi:MAG: hypothetical protein RL698_894 [Pseudomonadota bacterium]|jgi:AcrR family transcriptional regulator